MNASRGTTRVHLAVAKREILASILIILALLGTTSCKGEGDEPPAPAPPPVATSAPAPEDVATAPEPDTATATVADTASAPEPAADTTAADAPPAPAWWRGAVFYEIFVRSFADSDGDGKGDLQGLIDKLDYLNDGDPSGGDDLGVDALWLMPISPSPSYHGYDVTDYEGINPDYGTLETYDKLIAAAHQRGIRVITDFVLNHSSSQHPWFLDAKTGPDAAKRAFYSWVETPPEGWKRPWDGAPVWHQLGDWYYYAIFWSEMPDLNLGNSEVEDAMLHATRFWLDRGQDGFRVDAVRHLFEGPDGKVADFEGNHPFLKRFRKVLDAEYPKAVIVAEAWSGAEDQVLYYGDGDEFQLGFSFNTADKIRSAVKDGVRSDLNQMLDKAATVFARDPGFEAPFLTNHDMPRVMRQLGGDAGGMRLAAALLMAWEGTPFMYYGEEIGMQGGEGGADENKRTPMRWTRETPGVGFTTGTPWFEAPDETGVVDVASQLEDEGSLLRLYRRLIALRHAHPALRWGSQRRLEVLGGKGIVAFVRETPAERILVVVNLDREPSEAFDAPVTGVPRLLFSEGVTGPFATRSGAITVPPLGPRGFAFVLLR